MTRRGQDTEPGQAQRALVHVGGVVHVATARARACRRSGACSGGRAAGRPVPPSSGTRTRASRHRGSSGPRSRPRSGPPWTARLGHEFMLLLGAVHIARPGHHEEHVRVRLGRQLAQFQVGHRTPRAVSRPCFAPPSSCLHFWSISMRSLPDAKPGIFSASMVACDGTVTRGAFWIVRDPHSHMPAGLPFRNPGIIAPVAGSKSATVARPSTGGFTGGAAWW